MSCSHWHAPMEEEVAEVEEDRDDSNDDERWADLSVM